MSSAWNHKPWDPDVVYARPPARPVDWRLTLGRLLVALAVAAVWMIIGLLVWTQA